MVPLLATAASGQPLDPSKWTLRPESGKATLTFQAKRFAIKGCNSISGAFTEAGGRIVVSRPPISTRMGCPPGVAQLDQSLTAAVTRNKSFLVEGDRLTLTAQDGSTWEFTREPMASAKAVTKFIYVAAETKDCTGVAPMKCLQIREKPTGPWRLHYSGIRGFTHEPGIEYRLRIKEDRIDRPAADQSGIVWYLDLIVEQRVVKK